MNVATFPRPEPAETLAERIQRLQADLRAMNYEQIDAMRANVVSGMDVAREVATNPTQPDGVRQLAEKIVRDGESLILTLDSIRARGGR